MTDKPTIEYRVTPVTRYVVTRYTASKDTGSTTPVVEVDNFQQANVIAEALATKEPAWPATVVPFNQPPGKAMRCKVRLDVMQPAVQLVHHEWPGKSVTMGDRQFPDMQDPTNYRQDGVNVHFNAVYGGTDPVDGGNACHENRIFNHASPYVNFQAMIRNQEVTSKLVQGQEYYVDFIPANAK